MNSLRLPALLLLVCWFASVTSQAAEPPTAPVLRIEAGMHTAMINRISADAAGRLVLTVSDDKTARLWEMPSGRLLRVLRPPLGNGSEGKLYAGALSSDGALAAIGGFTGADRSENFSVYLFDTATGGLVRRIEGLSQATLDLAFSAQGRFLAAVLGAGKGLRVWETATGREVGRDTDYGERDSYSVDWHGQERLVTACDDGNLRLYRWVPGAAPGAADGKLTQLKRSTIKGGKEPYCCRFSPDGRQIAVGFYDSTSVAVVDANDLSFLFAPDTTGVDNGNIDSVVWINEGSILAAGGRWGRANKTPIRRWPKAGQGKPQDSVASSSTATDLRPLSGGRILFAGGDPAWGVIGPTGERQLLGTPPVADYRNGDAISHFRLASDGRIVSFGYEEFGKIPAQFSLAGRQLTLLKVQTPSNNLQASRIEGLKITDWKNSVAPKLDGKPIPLKRYERSRSLAIARDASSFLLGTEWYLHSFTAEGKESWKLPSPNVTWAVNLADSDRLAVAAYADGTIRWHRADTGQELLAFFPHADRKRWVLWTPEGYYDCSPGAEDLIGWHVNRGKDHEADFFPASKFREQFYRPDVIDRVLQTRDVAVALKEANEASGRKSQPALRIEDVVATMQPPVVELAVGGARGEASVPGSADTFTVRYRVRRGGAEMVTRVGVLVDGRRVSVEAPIPANDTTEASASVPLPSHDCVIAVLAENKFAASEPVTLRIVHAASPVAAPAVLKPRLYLFAAGIAHYKHNDQLPDLTYPPKDAQDFANAFKSQQGGLYQKVEVRVLTEKNAGATDILEGLEWIQHETTAKDVAVIFLSGHGDNDPDRHFYFCAQNYDRAHRLSTGVSQEQIQKALGNIAGKVLFFIDSCHAGNALGKLTAKGVKGVAESDVNRLANELSSAENGVIVFASSTGKQESLESDEWKNGAFTKAIVEGIAGQADLLRNGSISVSSLETYVAERVKKLTEGQQTPTVAKPQTVPDFPIAVKR